MGFAHSALFAQHDLRCVAGGTIHGESRLRRTVELVMETRGEWPRKVADEKNLPFSRVRALWRLERDARTMSELADEMGTDAPDAVVPIHEIEERGLVKRTQQPTDRHAKQRKIY